MLSETKDRRNLLVYDQTVDVALLAKQRARREHFLRRGPLQLRPVHFQALVRDSRLVLPVRETLYSELFLSGTERMVKLLNTNNPLPYDQTVIGAVNAVTTLLSAGFIKVYTGSQPALNGAVTGTLLATMTFSSQLNPPATATGSTVASGGTVANGVYHFVVTYVNASGETTASEYGTVTTTGTNISTLTVNSPAASGSATGWYAYVTQAGGSSAYQATRQQAAGSPTAIGTNLTLTAPPTSTGLLPPSVNTTGAFATATAAAGTVTGTANAITSGTAGNTGTAGYFALVKSDNATIVATGLCGLSSSDLNMNTLSITSGNTVSCSSFLVTMPET